MADNEDLDNNYRDQAPVAAPMTEPYVTSGPEYSWIPWWDADNVNPSRVWSKTPPLIFEKWGKLMEEVGSLAAHEKDGVKFKVKAAFGPDGLMSKLRPALDKLKLRATVVEQEGKPLETERGTCVFVRSVLRLCAEDGSFVKFSGVGHGADPQDKAGGKAHTYAWKAGWITFLNLDDADMPDTDDSDAPIKGGVKKGKHGTYSLDHDEFKQLIEDCDDMEELEALKLRIKDEGTRNDMVALAPFVKAQKKELARVAKAEASDGSVS